MSEAKTILSNSGARWPKALADLRGGLAHWELWATLGWHDIRQRYRRSVIGPFWITLSMGVMVASLGFLYSALFRQDLHTYLPFVSLGMIVWALIQGFTTEACSTFYLADSIIRQVRIPLSALVFRMMWKHIIIFAHNSVIYVLLMLILWDFPGSSALLVLPGFLLLCLNATWVGLLLGTLGARFRDLQPIVASVMQVIFFISPILWTKDQLPQHLAWFSSNPFGLVIDLIRMPLMGQTPPLSTWSSVIVMTIFGYALALAFFARFRGRIPYWV